MQFVPEMADEFCYCCCLYMCPCRCGPAANLAFWAWVEALSAEAILTLGNRQHRGEAIRLTHTWQRGMRRAAAAFAAGDSAAAGRLAREARRKR